MKIVTSLVLTLTGTCTIWSFRQQPGLVVLTVDKSPQTIQIMNETTDTTTSSAVYSVTLGNHMESIEYLQLQPWQTESIQIVHDRASEEKRLVTKDVCIPPAPHISTDFCCGGTTTRWRKLHKKGHYNNPFACSDKTLQDHDRVKEIALRYMVPLLSGRDNNKCDVCQIVQTLWEQNLRMNFVGDSVTHQMAYGWLCQLQTRNYEVTTTMIDGTGFHIHISSQHWGADGMVNMTFYNALKFPKKLDAWDELLTNVDILVGNYGVHWAVNATREWKTPESYRQGMNKTFQYWSNTSMKAERLPRLMAFRETSAQHFDSDSGEYFLYNQQQKHDNSSSSSSCVANPQTTHVGWREDIVNKVASDNGFQVLTADESLVRAEPRKNNDLELIWLPFLNFTSELHFMHSSKNALDCTHFCQSPYLWWPVWRSLRLAVDRAFVVGDKEKAVVGRS